MSDNNISGIRSKSKYTVNYFNIPSALRPVRHSPELAVSEPPQNMTPSDDGSADDEVDKEASPTSRFQIKR